MQIVFHIGANCTDGDILLRSLMKDVDRLGRDGVVVPGPGRYRKMIRETIQSLGPGADQPDPATRDVLLETILDGQEPRRMVMSNQAFLALPQRVFDGRQFYGLARHKVAALETIFAEDELELFVALRNPATFIPAVWAQATEESFDSFMGGFDPLDLRWSDLVARLRNAAPQARLTVWCNEDSLLIWNTLLHRLAGSPPGTATAEPLGGAWDMLATTMTPDGLARLLSYIKTHPGQSEAQVRLVIGAFLDKYAIQGEIEQEVDLPGWDMPLIEELTRRYEADVALIAAMEGVDFIAA
ncbi:MAG: hypothetical protein JJT81_17290 [Rubellimicrobium sp.]|nr:hypothetical protein [Rubellimicrobium sp.]